MKINLCGCHGQSQEREAEHKADAQTLTLSKGTFSPRGCGSLAQPACVPQEKQIESRSSDGQQKHGNAKDVTMKKTGPARNDRRRRSEDDSRTGGCDGKETYGLQYRYHQRCPASAQRGLARGRFSLAEFSRSRSGLRHDIHGISPTIVSSHITSFQCNF